MALEVYCDLLSQPCRAIVLFLRALEVPFSTMEISLLKGDNRTEQFSSLNPKMMVPVIVDDGFVLTESVAIMKYLAARCKAADHWYPADIQRRAKVDEYLAWQHVHTRPHAMKVFHLEGLLPKLTGQPVKEVLLSRALRELDETLDLLENMFLKDKKFLCADDISIADIMAICELMQPLGAGRDVLVKRPRLNEWKRRVVDHLGRQLFEDIHRVIFSFKDLQPPIQRPSHLIAFCEKLCGVSS